MARVVGLADASESAGASAACFLPVSLLGGLTVPLAPPGALALAPARLLPLASDTAVTAAARLSPPFHGVPPRPFAAGGAPPFAATAGLGARGFAGAAAFAAAAWGASLGFAPAFASDAAGSLGGGVVLSGGATTFATDRRANMDW